MTDDIHTSAASYAVGALPADEVAAYEEHLATCASCQADVAAYGDVTAALSESIATEPPAGLRPAVLAAIATTSQEPVSTGSADAVADTAIAPTGRHAAGQASQSHRADVDGSGGVATPDATSNVVALPRSRGRRATALVAAAAVLAAVGFGGWALKSRNDAQDQAQQYADQAARLAAVATAPDVQSASSSVSSGGTATVLRSQSVGSAMLVADDLPALPNGKTYEAWTIDQPNGSSPVPAGTFESGGVHTVIELPSAAVDTGTVAVTVEPDGGSPAPTTQPIVALTPS